jgi:hypothetical protein
LSPPIEASGAASNAPSGDRPSTVDACARIKGAS